ncbi:hypothetical protein GX865_01620 [Candidatus Saccharibacteria bacterium]|jgi:FKBP-type peptidyl-prolyl cis-trans isomerase FkpA|nr:hypothetical protein [Candidatus Saccharibacteria bacterium]
MATSKAHRIGIIIIAVVMAVGTIGSFFIMIVANKNQEIDARAREEDGKEFQKIYAEYEKEIEAYQKKLAEESEKLSPKYYDEMVGYKSKAQPFDGSKVKDLVKKDLKKGDGAEIKKPEEMRAYYIGWNEKGKIFDSSIKGESLAPPIDVDGVIQGWLKGVVGMKMGGVRELTIPSDLAYGDKKHSDDIPANAPLKFIIKAVPKSKLEEPPVPEELMKLMGQGM